MTTTVPRPWLLITVWALAGAATPRQSATVEDRVIERRRRCGGPGIGSMMISASFRLRYTAARFTAVAPRSSDPNGRCRWSLPASTLPDWSM